MTVRDDRGDVKQTTTGFRGPLMVQSLTSAKSKFLSLECGVHYKPNHLLSLYKTEYSLPVTEEVYENILTIPCHFDLTLKEQDYVIDKIKVFYESK